MATVINNPGGGDSEGVGVGMIVGIILAVLVIALLVIYGIPTIRDEQATPQQPETNINVTIPNPTSGTNSNGTGN